MNNNNIEPNKVTKPIQLLAAWLVGLVLVNSALLATSSSIEEPVWLKATLIISAILNIPLFIGAIFLLQTKFRPELQEDQYYSKYLDNTTNEYVTVTKYDEMISLIYDLKSELISVNTSTKQNTITPNSVNNNSLTKWKTWKIALCDFLPDFKEIQKDLKNNNVSISRIFGSTDTNKRPSVNVITFSELVDFDSIVKVLRMMSAYRFDGYNYFFSSHVVNMDEIFLGGFGYKNGGYYPFNDELKELLETDLDPSDLKYFESQNPRITSI